MVIPKWGDCRCTGAREAGAARRRLSTIIAVSGGGVDLRKRWLRLGLVYLACAAATTAAQVRYSVNGPVVLRNGAGAAAFTLTNAGAAPVPLALRLGTFSDDATQAEAGSAKVTFAPASGADMPASLAPGATLRIVANVSG